MDVKCPSSKTEGLWDYNAWKLNLDYIESNSKCNLTFTSTLSETEYKKYIESGIEYRRNTYRGKDITSYKSLEATNKMNLYNQISNCTFDDIYVGDYITGSQGVTWLIADINNYRYSGNEENGLERCHATIIPAGILGTGKMNATNTTDGGYLNSEMKQTTLPSILNKYVFQDFAKDHVLTYRTILSSGMDPARSNQMGIDSGASSDWTWVSSQIDLMSEVNLYGSIVWSSSGYDIGLDNRQYAIFKLKPDLINTDGNGKRYSYWLKAITRTVNFAFVNAGGYATGHDAYRDDGGIRPRFLIG